MSHKCSFWGLTVDTQGLPDIWGLSITWTNRTKTNKLLGKEAQREQREKQRGGKKPQIIIIAILEKMRGFMKEGLEIKI